MRKLLPLIIAVLAATTNFGQFAKKQPVTLKFNGEIPKFEKIHIWSASEQSLVTVSETSPGTIALNGRTNWREAGLPSLRPYLISDFKIEKKKSSEIILAEVGELRRVKILIPPTMDVQKTLAEILYLGNPKEFLDSEYFTGLLKKAAPTVFTGELADLPFEKHKELLFWSGLDFKAFGEKTYKEKRYLSVDTSQDVVYNTIQLNQAERVARQTQHVLKKIKELYKIIGKPGNYDGIRATAKISSYDFVRKDDTTNEEYEIYMPADLLRKFFEADITNQDLIDGSVILVDGTRVKADLTSFSE